MFGGTSIRWTLPAVFGLAVVVTACTVDTDGYTFTEDGVDAGKSAGGMASGVGGTLGRGGQGGASSAVSGTAGRVTSQGGQGGGAPPPSAGAAGASHQGGAASVAGSGGNVDVAVGGGGGGQLGTGGAPVVGPTDCTPSERRCSGLQPQTCDVSGDWQNEGALCTNVCASGSCVGICGAGALQCNGLEPQTCSAEGQWQSAGAACASICSAGKCSGTCTPGALRCEGAQPQKCDGAGAWKAEGTPCASVCSAGTCTGTCAPSSVRCNGLEPQSCSVAGLWEPKGAACPNVCVGGACSGSCVPESMRCSSLQPQQCSAAGLWQNKGSACASVCNSGSCLACSPSAKQCNGLQPQTCDAAGAWQNTGSPCPNVCGAGACTGVCKPSSVQCNGLQPQTCDAAGAWQNTGSPCANVCSAGACTGVCKPGALNCNGLQPQKCDAAGAWANNGAACRYVCTASTGACAGVCEPTAKRCNGLQPQTCNASGAWQNTGSECPYVCSATGGVCSGVCKPGAKGCNGGQPQKCDANGAWQNEGTPCGVCSVCSATTGACGPAPNGTDCSDGDLCTPKDSCQGGVCKGAQGPPCPEPTACHLPGTCDKATGKCSNPTVTDNTACGDDVGRCTAGTCKARPFSGFGAGVLPVAISDDGSSVVGYSPTAPAFRWTLASGIQVLPPPNKDTSCTVGGVDSTGAYSVGWCLMSSGSTPVRWAGLNAPIKLTLPSGFDQGTATAVSANGAIIAGSVISGESRQAALWASTSMPPTVLVNHADATGASANAISADGTVVVGVARLKSGASQAFSWTQAGGMKLIPFLAGTTFASQGAIGVSSNGTRVVGTSGNRPFLWTSGTPTAVGSDDGYARAISGDGATILHTASGGIALTAANSTQLLVTKLNTLRAEVTGWTLGDGSDLSANGKVIVGTGSRKDAEGNWFDEGWIAFLP